jgi:mannose-6-phosphate isomerase-like protein (cupin superfamily)
MRKSVFGVLLCMFVGGTPASHLDAQNQTASPQTVVSAKEISSFLAKAKSERKPDQASFVQAILRVAPNTVNLEYRVAGLTANASIHEHEAELFYVVDGSGTMVTGGTLREEKRTNAANLSGTGIDGGTSRNISKGDVLIVPENTPHWFGNINDTLVLISLHLPPAAANAAAR